MVNKDGGSTLFNMLYTSEGELLTGLTELNMMIDLAEDYGLSVSDLLTGKLDSDILKFLSIRDGLVEEVDAYPVQDVKDAKTTKATKPAKPKKDSKDKDSNVVDISTRFKKGDKDKPPKVDNP